MWMVWVAETILQTVGKYFHLSDSEPFDFHSSSHIDMGPTSLGKGILTTLLDIVMNIWTLKLYVVRQNAIQASTRVAQYSLPLPLAKTEDYRLPGEGKQSHSYFIWLYWWLRVCPYRGGELCIGKYKGGRGQESRNQIREYILHHRRRGRTSCL